MKFDFFKTKIFTDWFNEALKHSDNTVMDPFAGTNSLIKELLKLQDFNSRDIQKLTKLPKDDVIFALQKLLEEETISIKSNNLYSLIQAVDK